MKPIDRVLWVMLASTLIAGCGGGGDEDSGALSPSPGAPSLATAAAETAGPEVQLDGCTVNLSSMPAPDIPVSAFTAGRRLLASSFSDDDGHFKLRVPAQSPVTVKVEMPGGDALPLQIGAGDVSIGACLSDRSG